MNFSSQIIENLLAPQNQSGWFLAGVKYASYNLGLIPAVLFCLRHIKTRQQALGAALLTGIIAIMPALLFYLAMLGVYPDVIAQEVPSTYILSLLNNKALMLFFHIVFFGTLIETAIGLIHALNE